MPKKYLILILSVFNVYFCSAQDLFTEEKSLQFAEYLMKSGQFDLATVEFERLVYMRPQADSLKASLLKSYRLGNQIKLGIQRAQLFFPDQSKMPFIIAIENAKLLMQTKDWEASRLFWNQNIYLSNDDKVLLNTTINIFENQFPKALSTLKSIQDKEHYLAKGYSSIIDKKSALPLKSPVLAGVFSGLVPGLGKVYARSWKDGLVALLFVGGMAFQSYRNFNKHGTDNYRGWVYGSIGLGFYLGNIHGSVKNVKDFNRKKINVLQHEASALFNTYY
jgi:hypothetical protein